MTERPLHFAEDEEILLEEEIDLVDEYGYRRNPDELSGHNAGLVSVRRQRDWWSSEFPLGMGAVDDCVAQRWRTHSSGRTQTAAEVDASTENSTVTAAQAQPKRRPSLTSLSTPKEKDAGTKTF